jgi:hypothetical protein
MKTKLATLLAVVMFVAVGAINASLTNAKNAKGYPPHPTVDSKSPLTTGVAPQAGNPNFGNNRGRITRIYPEPTGVYFTFGCKPGEWQTAMNPVNGYYYIPMSHPNYRALVDLLYLAAEHDWNLKARTQPTLGTAGRADVIYLVQDFSRP